MKIIKNLLKYFSRLMLFLLAIIVALLIYSNIPVSKENENVELGVTFSHRYAADIGLDWKKAYLAVLDDLKIKKIRIPVYWDLIEKEEGRYDFSDVDWQLEEARKRNTEIILTFGQKVPRWPECAIPKWAAESDAKRKESLLKLVDIVINRYKDHSEIKYWQVENEPFLLFGICPKPDGNLLDSEIALVRKIDSSRKIITSDSGELSLWVQAAKRADVFGTTMYRNIYKEGLGYYTYPLGPRFFHLKYEIINIFARQENAIVVELQAEPWIQGWTVHAPIAEQYKSMNAKKLRENVSYAKKVGFPQIYLWGVEWWYWLKTEKNQPEVWETARELFNTEK